MKDTIIMNDITNEILLYENKYIFHPEYFGVTSIWQEDPNFKYNCMFVLKDYKLYLESFIVTSDKEYPVINGVAPEPYYSEDENEKVQYCNLMEPMKYTGGIIIGNLIVNEYSINDMIPCFSYKNVTELIFREGNLITTVDHSRDMLRIRRNLDLGLRKLSNKQDFNCIYRFLKSSFVGEYFHSDKVNKVKKLKTITNIYTEKLKKKHHLFMKKGQ